MTLAGIELAYLIKEIGEKTQGCYVSNIYGITKDSLLLRMSDDDLFQVYRKHRNLPDTNS